jgi:hypothetical protein
MTTGRRLSHHGVAVWMKAFPQVRGYIKNIRFIDEFQASIPLLLLRPDSISHRDSSSHSSAG